MAARSSTRCVIVGAGHGGVQVAASLRNEGFAGEIVVVDADQSVPYHKPPLSKTFFETPRSPVLELQAPTFYADASVDARLGTRVIDIDRARREVFLDSGEALAYSHLVIATGSKPIDLINIKGAGLRGILTLRSLNDARSISGRLAETSTVAIVGGGFIGIELAHTLNKLGKMVTVLESAPRILGRVVSPVTSDYMLRRTRECGIEIRLDAKAEAFLGNGTVTSVATDCGAPIECQMAIVAVGARAVTELAAKAGLAVDGGIVVDEFLQTEDSHIFAIGDCSKFPEWRSGVRLRLESVQNATDQAKTVAKTIAGRPTPYRSVPWFWSDSGDMRLQIAGVAGGADRSIVSGEPNDGSFAVYRYDGDRLVCVEALNRPSEYMLARKLLAADISPTRDDILAGPARLRELLAVGSAPRATAALERG